MSVRSKPNREGEAPAEPDHEGSELPEGWARTTLSELASLVSGAGFPIEQQNQTGLQLPFFKVGNLGQVDSGQPLLNSNHSVSTETARNLGAKIIPKDAIVFAKIGMAIALNRRRLLGQPSCIDNNMMAAIPGAAVETKYLLRYVETVDLMPLAQATTVPSLRKGDLESIAVPLPPLAEQRRIVGKLELLLGKVSSSQQRLSRVPGLLKRFRQSVLAAACSGKLTADWREDGKRVNQTTPVTIGRPDAVECLTHWECALLTDVATLESGHTPRKTVPEYWENGDVPWISLQDIREANGKEIVETKLMPTMLGIENSSARLLPKGTVVFSRDISVGYVTIMGREMATTQHFANWICSPRLSNRYLMFALMASRESLVAMGQGSTVGTIYMPALKEFHILLPPLSEQQEIVHRVEKLFAFADQIEARLKHAQAHVDRLTQSLLRKAFRGELVPTEHALATREGREYETAAELLKRIRGTPAPASPAMPKRKKAIKA